MDFCKDVVNYDPALPSPKAKATPVNELVKAQEDAAMTMFVYHLNGMGYDSWDYRTPSMSDSDCVRSVWKMVCFTYFPRAEAGCKLGEQSMYKRPCSSCCQNYIQHCGVECCDESVQCVFAHTKYNSSGKLQLLQTGYVDHSGPSAACTGSSRRSFSSPLMLLLAIFGLQGALASNGDATNRDGPRRRFGFSKTCLVCLLVAMTCLLQGCDIPHHKVGNWRAKKSYLGKYRFVPPGKTVRDAVLNSCSQKDVSSTLKCNGRGYCKTFTKSGTAALQAMKLAPLSFCECDLYWADPECGTMRQSQMTTFLFAIFFSPFGADYFYLGFILWGMFKLIALGGFGFCFLIDTIRNGNGPFYTQKIQELADIWAVFKLLALAVFAYWWLLDIIRVGSGNVYASKFRTAPDLPHWAANLVIVTAMLMLGFGLSIATYIMYRTKKRKDIANLCIGEESEHMKHTKEEYGLICAQDVASGWSGYGSTVPMELPNAQALLMGPRPIQSR
jgi:TM2 domain-containing membrane protein YozV